MVNFGNETFNVLSKTPEPNIFLVPLPLSCQNVTIVMDGSNIEHILTSFQVRAVVNVLFKL